MNNQIKKKVLVIEDEPSVRKALVEKCEHEGFLVSQAKNGQEGLELALEVHPDVILLDIVMPKMDGMSVMKTLREDQWGKTAKIIILTNLDTDDAILSNIIEHEPSYYLIKSNWRIEDVITKIKELL